MVTNEFVSDCISGNEESIHLLVRTHQRAVFRLALSILDRSDASPEEIAEQAEIATLRTFIVALDRIGRYRQDTPFPIWLSRIAIEVSQKRFRDWQRKRHAWAAWAWLRGSGWRSTAAERPPSPADQSASRLLPNDVALWQAVCQLDEKLRLPLVLRYYHDMQINEIASVLRLKEGVIYARLDQAREKIAQL